MQQVQVGLRPAPYLPHMDMLPHLAQAARDARKAKKRKQVHVASSLDRDQSTIARFEAAARAKRKIGWPKNADAVVAAYAEDLDISRLEIWQRAVKLMEAAMRSRGSQA